MIFSALSVSSVNATERFFVQIRTQMLRVIWLLAISLVTIVLFENKIYTPNFSKRFQHKKNQQNKLLNFSKIFAELQHNVADQLSKLLDGSAS